MRIRFGIPLLVGLVVVAALAATALLVQPTEAANCPASIAYGDTHDCDISVLGEEDTFPFSGVSGEDVLARVARSGSPVDPDVAFRRPNGTTPPGCSAAGHTSVDITCTLDVTGTWELVIADEDDNETGAYGFYLQRLDGPVGATALAFGNTALATLAVGEFVDYSVTGANGEVVLARAARSGSPVDPEIWFVRPDGSVACSAASSGSQNVLDLTCTLDVSGTWLLLIGDTGGSEPGGVNTYLQRLSDPVGATAHTYDSIASGTIVAGEFADYTFSGTSGEVVMARGVRAGSAIDPEIWFVRPDGTVACEETSVEFTKALDVACSIDTTGSWLILVGDSGGTDTGGVDTYLQRLNPAVGAGSIAYGGQESGTFATVEFIEWAFIGSNGDVADLNLSTSGSGVVGEIRLYRPDGTLLCQGPDGDLSCSLDQSGTWLILLGDEDGTAAGSYTVSLNWAVSAPTEPFEPEHATSDPEYWAPVSPINGFEVNLASGDFSHGNTDVVIPGRGIPLVFQRTYHSGLARVGSLGPGWTHNYEMRLEFATDEVSVFHPWGHARRFAFDGTDYVPRPGVQDTLIKNPDDSFTLTTKLQLVYDFDASGNFTAMTDRNGNTTTLSYDVNGNIDTITDPGGRTLIFTFDGQDRITQIAVPLTRTIDFTYDGSGNLATVSDLDGKITTYAYTADGMQTITDPLTHVPVTNTYDTDGRVVELDDALSNTTCYYYGTGATHSSVDCPTITPAPTSVQTIVVDRRGNKTTYEFDDLFRRSKITSALGDDALFAYDSANNLISSTDFNGRTTSFTYDAQGNMLTRVVPPGSRTWTFTYDSFNNLKTTTDPLMHLTTNTYDAAGNLIKVEDAEMGITLFTIAANGDVTDTTDPRLKVTQFGYNADGNRTSVTNPLSKIWTSVVDAAGRITSATDPLMHTTTLTYDDMNRLLSAENHLTQKVTQVYDVAGNLTSITDANNHQTQLLHDDANQLIEVKDPLVQASTLQYDANGNPTQQTNVRGKITTTTYDALNRPTDVEDPLLQTASVQYDAGGNVTQRTDARGLVTVYTYDTGDRLTKVEYKDGMTIVETIDFTYDVDDRRTQMTDDTGLTTYAYDDADRLTSLTAPVTGAVAYTYDAAGNITRITYPNVSKFVDYAYDDAGRLDTVTDWLSQVTDYTYDDAGRLTQASLPNGVDTDYTYDDGDRLLTVTNGNPTTFSSFTYTLDPGGNRTQVVDNAGTTTFTLDTLDRLTQVSYPGLTDTYTYDAIGNRLTRNAVASTYDDADQLLTVGGSTYGTYDANGNLITRGSDSFDYDHENRLTGTTIGGVTASSVYNGGGLRVQRTESAQTTDYVWHVLAPVPVLLMEGDNLLIQGHDLIASVDSAGTFSYFSSDGLGSTSEVTNASGTVIASFTYDVFGGVRSQSGTAPLWLFTGEQVDGYVAAGGSETLPLDGVISSTNLSGATVANLDDDPDADEGDWATAVDGKLDTTLRVAFPTPSQTPTPGAGLQEFRVLLRKNASGGSDPTYDLELWETGGGSALATLASGVTLSSDTGTVVAGTWDASLLTNADGSGAELRVVGNRSGGNPNNRRTVETGAVEWVIGIFTTDREPLDTVVSSTNLSGATVANLDDDPDSPDADWATADDGKLDTAIRVGFATPANTPASGTDRQEFRVLLRKNASGGSDPDYDLELWETGGGAPLATLASGVTLSSDSGIVVSVTWDASLLAASDGSAVELRIVGNASGGNPNNRRTVEVGAIEWNVTSAAAAPGETGLYYLRNRHYDPATGRFLSRDPLSLPQRYAYAGNNPATFVDPLGLYHVPPFPELPSVVNVSTAIPYLQEVWAWTWLALAAIEEDFEAALARFAVDVQQAIIEDPYQALIISFDAAAILLNGTAVLVTIGSTALGCLAAAPTLFGLAAGCIGGYVAGVALSKPLSALANLASAAGTTVTCAHKGIGSNECFRSGVRTVVGSREPISGLYFDLTQLADDLD